MEWLVKQNVFDEEIMQNPREFDEYLLLKHPVFWDEFNGFYIISSYSLITEVLQDADRFSSEYLEKFLPQVDPPKEVAQILARGCPLKKALLVTDGHVHREHRRIINRALSAKKLAWIAPAIGARIDRLLAPLIPRGRMQFRSEFAEHVPLYITQEILKIPDEDMPTAIEWSKVVSSGFGALGKSLDQQKDDALAIIEFQEYFRRKLEKEMSRIGNQGGLDPDDDDLCSLLAAAVLDADTSMDMSDALSFLLVLIPATHDTTTGTLTACMKSLVDHPDVQYRLAIEPDLVPKFIDESMRYESPNRAFWRRATRSTTLGGIDIPEGAWLLVRVTAANHDPVAYNDPYSFDPNRVGEKPHLEFGTGVHICAGRPIARHIVATALTKIVSKARNFRFIAGENDFARERNLLFSSYVDLSIEFEPVLD